MAILNQSFLCFLSCFMSIYSIHVISITLKPHCITVFLPSLVARTAWTPTECKSSGISSRDLVIAKALVRIKVSKELFDQMPSDTNVIPRAIYNELNLLKHQSILKLAPIAHSPQLDPLLSPFNAKHVSRAAADSWPTSADLGWISHHPTAVIDIW